MKTIVLILSSILFFSCSSKQAKVIPSWYLNPPQNDSLNLYGVGYGNDKQNSEKNALDNLAQKIIVNISSSMEILKQESSYNQKSNFSESSQQKIKSEVAKISFVDFKNEKTEFYNNQIYSLVSVDRQNLINQYTQKVENCNEEINQIVAQQKNKSIIEQKAGFVRIDKLIAKAEPNIVILESISINSEDVKQYKSNFQKLGLEHKDLNNKLNVYVKADNNSKKVADVIKAEFAKNDIKVNSQNSISQDQIIVEIKSNQTKQFIYGTYIIKSEINIAFTSNNGLIIKNKLIRENGSSAISYDEAETNLARKLAKIFNKSPDIFSQLGFN
jgi:hypothetical protein